MYLLGNGRLVTRDVHCPFLENGCVAIEGHLIAEVGGTQALRAKYPDAPFMDARGGVIMPGCINADVYKRQVGSRAQHFVALHLRVVAHFAERQEILGQYGGFALVGNHGAVAAGTGGGIRCLLYTSWGSS